MLDRIDDMLRRMDAYDWLRVIESLVREDEPQPVCKFGQGEYTRFVTADELATRWPGLSSRRIRRAVRRIRRRWLSRMSPSGQGWVRRG